MLSVDFSLWPLGSLWLQVANFLLLLLLMNTLLYKPIRRILSQRKGEVDALEKTIEDYLNRSEQSEKGIEERKSGAQKQGHVEKENLKGQGLEEEKGILQAAGSLAEERISVAEKEMEMRIEDVRKALEGQVAAFSNELAEKILGRSIQ